MRGAACAAVRHWSSGFAPAPAQVEDLGLILRIWSTERVVARACKGMARVKGEMKRMEVMVETRILQNCD